MPALLFKTGGAFTALLLQPEIAERPQAIKASVNRERSVRRRRRAGMKSSIAKKPPVPRVKRRSS